MSRTLFQITDDLAALDDLLDEVGGDVSDPRVAAAVEAWMAELDSDLNRKVDGYAAFITELEARSESRSKEAARLAARAKSDANKAGFLKERLRLALQSRKIKKLETDRYLVTVATNGGKQPLDIHDPNAVPPEYREIIPQTWELNADKIRAALADGMEVPGAILMDRGTHLRIK